VATLAELSVGDSAVVEEIAGTDAISLRMMEMGIVPGTMVKLLGRAPLGDPLEFELRGFRLSLRVAEAARVTVRMN